MIMKMFKNDVEWPYNWLATPRIPGRPLRPKAQNRAQHRIASTDQPLISMGKKWDMSHGGAYEGGHSADKMHKQ